MLDFQQRGRVIAQAFYSELEKIALTGAQMRPAAVEALGRLGRELPRSTAEAVGPLRFVPFTPHHRAWSASVGQGLKLQGEAYTRGFGLQVEATKMIREGLASGDMAKVRQGQQLIQEARAINHGGPFSQSTFSRAMEQGTRMDEPTFGQRAGRAALIGGGLAAGTGAAYVGGRAYVKSKQDQQQAQVGGW